MRNLIVFLLTLLSIQVVTGQNPDRKYESHNEENGIFSVVTSDGTYHFQFYSESILQTSFIPSNESEIHDSHAVIMTPKQVETSYSYVGKNITFGSSGMAVTITTEPFKINYTYQGIDLVSEKRGYFRSRHEPMDLVKGNIVADSTEKIEFNLTKDEVLYGAGARALDMNRRGKRLPLFNRAHYGYETYSELMNYTLPIVLSSKMYMIHFDNAPIGYLDLDSKSDNALTYETISGRKTYQIISGDSWYDLIESYTDLTGKQPLLPRWALGNFSSRFGYHSQNEVLETIKKFKDEKIPVDAIILDLYWFGKDVKGTMGNLAWDRDSFPNPDVMIKQLREQDIETILITEPFVLTTSDRWQESVSKEILAKDSVGNPATYDFYFGNTGIIDIYSAKGKEWFKDIYKDLSKQGVTGFWGDLGEPEVHPSWVKHATGTADEVHNIYGHDWAKLVYESSLEAKPNLRPFVLMRAGYSGSQRYGLIPWTGDVSRSWGGLQSQPKIALQMGMQGIGYMHSDLGGFAGANLDDELYARWLQYGVFQPIFRPHAQEDVPSEPVFRSKKAKAFANYAIQMRYRLLPYNYHQMVLNHLEGRPLMSPLFFEEPENKTLYNYSSTYLWGTDILVSPVLAAGKTEQDVYFPSGSYWFNIENDDVIKGGQTKNIELHEAYIPTYVRAGAFIPLAKSMQSTKDYDSNFIQLQYYHHDAIIESEREFYFDDGYSTDVIEQKKYQILEFEAEQEGRWLEFDFEAETGVNFEAQTKTIELVVHNLSKSPTRIKVDNVTVDGSYNEAYKTLSLSVKWDTTKEMKIRIKLKK